MRWLRFLGAALLALLLLPAGCRPARAPSPSPAVPEAGAATSPPPPPRLQKARIESRQGRFWVLESEELEYDREQALARAGELTWHLYGSAREEVVLTATARGARVDLEARRVEFEGPVEAVGREGQRLRARHLEYDGEADRFYGSQGVRLERPDSVVTGREATVSGDLRRVQVRGEVTGSMLVP